MRRSRDVGGPISPNTNNKKAAVTSLAPMKSPQREYPAPPPALRESRVKLQVPPSFPAEVCSVIFGLRPRRLHTAVRPSASRTIYLRSRSP